MKYYYYGQQSTERIAVARRMIITNYRSTMDFNGQYEDDS